MPETKTAPNQGKSGSEGRMTQKTAERLAPPSPRRHNFITTLVATMNMPPYSMIICMSIYFGLLYATIYWSLVYLRTLLILYMAHAVVLDRTAQATTKPKLVERLQPKCNKNIWFRLTAKYFSCKLHPPPSQKLDPDQSYLFAYHPHGIIGMGASLALATDASGFSTIFPGIQRSGVTLNVSFWVPFFKEWLLINGFCSANKPTLESRLSSESIVLIPGGAVEALHCKPKTMRLIIRKRKGFIRLAMETKAAVVPCIGFGENDIFDTICVGDEHSGAESSSDGLDALNVRSLFFKLQTTLYKVFSFSMPLWTHLIPIAYPINVVVGEPIHFSGKPDPASVDECHARYLKALQDLYDEHKAKYGYEDVPLELL